MYALGKKCPPWQIPAGDSRDPDFRLSEIDPQIVIFWHSNCLHRRRFGERRVISVLLPNGRNSRPPSRYVSKFIRLRASIEELADPLTCAKRIKIFTIRITQIGGRRGPFDVRASQPSGIYSTCLSAAQILI